MADFLAAYYKTLRDEGGYTTQPNETYCGIDRKHHPNWPGWETIDAAKTKYAEVFNRDPDQVLRLSNPELRELVKQFYLDWWDRYRCGELKDQTLAEYVYSFTFTNPAAAARSLQHAINALGGAVAVDGVIGPKTIAAANAIIRQDTLLKALRVYMAHYYLSLGQLRYIDGWLNRALT